MGHHHLRILVDAELENFLSTCEMCITLPWSNETTMGDKGELK